MLVFSLFFPVYYFILRSNNQPSINTTIAIDKYISLEHMVAVECPLLLDKGVPARDCLTETGARVVTQHGKRVLSLSDIQNGDVLHMVFVGTHFVYHQPLHREFVTGSGIRLKQISYSPRLFEFLDPLLDDRQMSAIITRAAPLVAPSRVGDGSGAHSKERTSFNTVDPESEIFKGLKRNVNDLLVLDDDPNLVEPMQVVRYLPGEFYMPHTDYFQGNPVYDPMFHNGSNRFATVFMYLNDVETGGETIFPGGEEGVMWGLERLKDECVPYAQHIQQYPRKGKAILFYSQHPNGTLDKNSVHAACPPLGSVKWAANLWVWNRPQIAMSDECPIGGQPLVIKVENSNPFDVDIVWVKEATHCSDTEQARVLIQVAPAGTAVDLNSFEGHVMMILNSKNNYSKCFVVGTDVQFS
jgi:prolyl 4-hydroxylase